MLRFVGIILLRELTIRRGSAASTEHESWAGFIVWRRPVFGTPLQHGASNYQE